MAGLKAPFGLVGSSSFFVLLFGDWPGVLPPRRFPAAESLLMSMVMVVSLPAVYVLLKVWI